MKIYLLITLIVLAFCSNISAQKLEKTDSTIGVGLLHVSPNYILPLYLDENSEMAFDTMKFFRIDTGEHKGAYSFKTNNNLEFDLFNYYSGDSDNMAVRHIACGLTYIIPKFGFKVISANDSSFCVVINEKTLETAVIKRDKNRRLVAQGRPYWNGDKENDIWMLYENWEDYLKRMIHISFENIDVYDSIGGKKITLDYKAGNVLRLDGNWAEIERRRSNDKMTKGWIKWTDGKKLNVQCIPEVYF